MSDRFDNGVSCVIAVLTPKGEGWTETCIPLTFTLGFPCRAFVHELSGLRALSAVETIADANGTRPEFHISISRLESGKTIRCSSNAARWVLQQFGLEGYFEDNHVPSGKVRNFWRPVADSLVGRSCPCEASEPEIREDRGDYIWRPAPDHA